MALPVIALVGAAVVGDYAVVLTAMATVLGAMAGILKVILGHLHASDAARDQALADQDARHQVAIDAMQQRQEKFLGNHMSANTRAMERIVEKLEEDIEMRQRGADRLAALEAEAAAAHRAAELRDARESARDVREVARDKREASRREP